MSVRHLHVAIVGAGFSGLGAAIRLLDEGERDFLIFERAAEVGGVWRDNVYPGCACDVEGLLYSYSFSPNRDVRRAYSTQPEILAYVHALVRRHALEPYLRFGHAVRSLTWDGDGQRWRLETSEGAFTADVVVVATGGLSEPKLPSVPGLERFTGEVFHTARWNTEAELRDRRVAVIGTGASAIQLVPELQPRVRRLVLFQRTPPWVLPRALGPRYDARRAAQARSPLYRLSRAAVAARYESYVAFFRSPALGRIPELLARRYLARAVADPVLRDKLTPRYRFGCKRVLASDDYLPSLQRENVELVASALSEVRAHEVVAADGSVHEVDAIVFATGFQATEHPFARHVRGREGRTLAEVWAGSPKAHAGTTVSGFPNLFLIPGPNTGLGHTSVLIMAEAQIEHLLGALRVLRDPAIAAIEPRAEAQARWVARVQRGLSSTVWNTGGCDSWYLDRTGVNSSLWPWSTPAFARAVRFRRGAHHLEARRSLSTKRGEA